MMSSAAEGKFHATNDEAERSPAGHPDNDFAGHTFDADFRSDRVASPDVMVDRDHQVIRAEDWVDGDVSADVDRPLSYLIASPLADPTNLRNDEQPFQPADFDCQISDSAGSPLVTQQLSSLDASALTSVRQDRRERLPANQREIEPLPELAASYSRFSSDQQREESSSDQQRRCRDAACANGHSIVPAREFQDAATSGTKRQRKGLTAMLKATSLGSFSTLYLFSLSRLARECTSTLSLLKTLVSKYKIRVISITDGMDTNVANWELTAAIMSCVGEQSVDALPDHAQ